MHSPLRTLLLATLAPSIVLAGCQPSLEVADLILTNANVVTVDRALPEAEAVAIRGDRILAVGSAAEVDRYRGATTDVMDLEGRLVVPGFIEGHGHFMGVGDAQLQLDLMAAESWEEIVDMVAAAVDDAEPGELIRGRGWHQEKWTRTPVGSVDGVPTHQALSAVSPDNPVLLTHASGHATFANAAAMELSGVTAATPPPSGGEIVHDRAGQPTGLFRETASSLLAPTRRGAAPVDPRRRARLAAEEVLSKGVTSFQDAGSDPSTIEILKEMVDAGELDVRLWIMVRGSNDVLAEALPRLRTIGYGDGRLTVRAIKRSIDGALGPHGAWLLQPYEDIPSSSGLNTSTVESIEETARLALEHGFQLCVHAIGDRANRETLDIFERALGPDGAGADRRWRVEHAQHLHPDDVPRFAALGVIAAVQGVHATSDAPYVLERLGERRAREGAYVWRDLMDAGAVLVNGTDAPVEDVNPIASFAASVSRRTKDGWAFYPEQRMTRLEALESYTLNAAYGAFEEEVKGSITPGKLADLVVLSRDIMTIPEEEIPQAEVLYTIVGGRVVYAG